MGTSYQFGIEEELFLADGTSADIQRSIYARARASGRTSPEALAAVIDWMARVTDAGADTAPT